MSNNDYIYGFNNTSEHYNNAQYYNINPNNVNNGQNQSDQNIESSQILDKHNYEYQPYGNGLENYHLQNYLSHNVNYNHYMHNNNNGIQPTNSLYNPQMQNHAQYAYNANYNAGYDPYQIINNNNNNINEQQPYNRMLNLFHTQRPSNIAQHNTGQSVDFIYRKMIGPNQLEENLGDLPQSLDTVSHETQTMPCQPTTNTPVKKCKKTEFVYEHFINNSLYKNLQDDSDLLIDSLYHEIMKHNPDWKLENLPLESYDQPQTLSRTQSAPVESNSNIQNQEFKTSLSSTLINANVIDSPIVQKKAKKFTAFEKKEDIPNSNIRAIKKTRKISSPKPRKICKKENSTENLPATKEKKPGDKSRFKKVPRQAYQTILPDSESSWTFHLLINPEILINHKDRQKELKKLLQNLKKIE